MSGIKFGTDGWRAIIDKDFNRENVIKVCRAAGKYVYKNFGCEKKIIIGYDPRHKADEFSYLGAEVLSEAGFEVLYSDKIAPTPVLAYNAKILNACALMFTASHNPPEYLGIKFIPDYAGPATAEITDEIVSYLEDSPEKYGQGKIVKYDFSTDYFRHLETLIDFEKIKTLKTNIIYDGLYSASIGYFDKLLDLHGIKYDTLHMAHDPDFGGGMPEPKPEYLKALIEKVKATPESAGFANDGDSDRFGVINENGEYVTPNEIIAILLIHLTKNKHLKGPLVKTVGASLLLDITAQKLGVDVIETAVGFKHVGEAMRKFNPVIGGEESGGLSIQGHIPEKDGILANLLILEAMAYYGKPLFELQKDLEAFAGCRFYNNRIDLKVSDRTEVQKVLDIFKTMEAAYGYKITKRDFKDGVKLYLDDGRSWILVRPSGTEPLLRIYFESDSSIKLEELNSYIKDMSF